MNKNHASLAIRWLAALIGVCSLSSLAIAQDVITYYHNDLVGSPIAGSDKNGNIVWREDFTPYGEKRLRELSSGSNRRAFTGHSHEDFTGLTYMGARHYDPMVGRFMSVDPIAPNSLDQFSFNRYTYGNNNPYGYIDPTGESPEGSEWMYQGIAIIVTSYSYERMLDRQTDLKRRINIANMYAASLDHFNADGNEAYVYERKTRPTTLRDPHSLKPTQPGYGPELRGEDGKKISIEDLAEKIRKGEVPNMEPVRVFIDESGVLRTIDHKRVEAYKLAGKSVPTLELTLNEAKSLSGKAGQRARHGRFDEIKPVSELRSRGGRKK